VSGGRRGGGGKPARQLRTCGTRTLNTGDQSSWAQSNVERGCNSQVLLNNSKVFIIFLCVDEVQSFRLSSNLQISSNRKVRISFMLTEFEHFLFSRSSKKNSKVLRINWHLRNV
jgi:hypothetical protein